MGWFHISASRPWVFDDDDDDAADDAADDIRFVIMSYPKSGIGEVSEFDSQYQPQERNYPPVQVNLSKSA